MMKSRGLRPANYTRIALQSPLRAPRQFSTHASLKTPVLLRARNPSLGLRSALNAPALRTPLVAGSVVSAMRFASTAATSSVLENSKAAAADAASSTPVQAASESVDGVTDAFLANIANMPEQIGYLKAIGLDYGWGPTSCIEWLLEHVHIWGDLPWWSSIIATAVIVRTALFPLFMKTSDVTARQTALKEITDPLSAKMNAARIAGNTDQMMMARMELMQVYKHAGIKVWEAFYAPAAQAITGYCTWKLLRAMAALPVPGLETGGLLWLKDLTVADPYCILPIAFGALIHLISRTGGETGAMKQLTGLQRKFLLYFMPIIAVVFTIAQPATVQLSFFAASTLGMLQSKILRNPSVRDMLGLSPIIHTSPTPRPGVIDVQARSISPTLGQFKWEPPSVKSSIAHAGPINKKTVEQNPLDRLKSSYKETRKELREFKEGVLRRAGMAQDSRAKTKQTKEFLSRAADYEKRRQAEEKADRPRRRR